MAYSDMTIRDSNPIKRWLQRRRLADALRMVDPALLTKEAKILDFGAGDGVLAQHIVTISSAEAWVYEPTPSLMMEARERLSGASRVKFVENVAAVESSLFDYVFCLEVIEHLPEAETHAVLTDIDRLLKPDGVAIIGVPHEIFLPALLKGLFRISRRYGDFDASPGNILAATLGRPPSPRPACEIAPGFSFHIHHLGFDFRLLERTLRARFHLEDKWFSPFPQFGIGLNSEVYFLVRKEEQVDCAHR